MLDGCLDGRTLSIEFTDDDGTVAVDADEVFRQIEAANPGYRVHVEEIQAAMALTDDVAEFFVHLSRVCAVKLAAAKNVALEYRPS